MSIYVKLFNLVLIVAKSPITRQIWQQYTGKPLTAKGFYEVISQTRTFQHLEKKAFGAAKAAEEAIKFDPKNPAHYRPQNPEDYNPMAVRFKALKTAFTAAKEAVDAEAKGQKYQPTYPVNPAHYQPQQPVKPITKPNRMIDV